MLSHLTLVGRDYPSEQYAAMFSAGETRAQVAMTAFDNVTEGIENFTAVLNLSEYIFSRCETEPKQLCSHYLHLGQW